MILRTATRGIVQTKSVYGNFMSNMAGPGPACDSPTCVLFPTTCFPVGRLFGTSRPNTVACVHG